MKDSQYLRYLPGLMLGIPELSFHAASNEEQARAWRRHHYDRLGFLPARSRGGGMGTRWSVANAASLNGNLLLILDDYAEDWSTVLDLAPLMIDPEGYLCEFDGFDDTVIATVPDDGVWYTLVARRALELRERGSLNLIGGSNTVIGTNTSFTKYAGKTTDSFGRGTLLRVDLGDTLFAGNAQTYEIDEVVSDTEIRLVSAIGLPTDTETSVPFRVRGKFVGAVPADPDAHQRWVVQFELVARTVVPAAGDLLVADVMYDSGLSASVYLVQKQTANLAMERPSEPQGLDLVMSGYWDNSGVYARHERFAYAGATNALDMAICASENDGGNFTAVVQVAASIESLIYDRKAGTWSAGGTVDATGTAVGCAIESVPQRVATDPTHQAFYSKAGIAYRRPSVDYSVTWGAEVLVWDPTVVDAADTVVDLHCKRLLNGRLILLGTYYDDSAAAGAGQTQIRYVFSDDYGATWDTNGHEGYTWVASQSGGGPTYHDTAYPCLWQAPNGRIVTAWQDGLNVRFEFSHYDYKLDRDPDGTFLPRRGFEIGGTGNIQGDPAVWTDGYSVALVYVDQDTLTDIWLGQSTYQTGQLGTAAPEGDNRLVYQVFVGSVAFRPLACCFAQGANGRLHLLYRGEQAVDPAAHIEFIPTKITGARPW